MEAFTVRETSDSSAPLSMARKHCRLKTESEEDVTRPGLGTQEAGAVVSSHGVHHLLEVVGHLYSCHRLDSANDMQTPTINGQ